MLPQQVTLDQLEAMALSEPERERIRSFRHALGEIALLAKTMGGPGVLFGAGLAKSMSVLFEISHRVPVISIDVLEPLRVGVREATKNLERRMAAMKAEREARHDQRAQPEKP
jgi:hypothetical protein